jgi:multiple sugar transport system substrate-binding protein
LQWRVEVFNLIQEGVLSLKIKKLAVSGMSLVLGLGIVTGCSTPTPKQGEETTKPSNGDAKSSSASNKETVINLQMWEGPEGEAMRPVIDAWNKTKVKETGIKINLTLLGRNGYADKLTSQLLAKSSDIDIVYPMNWFIPQFAQGGFLEPLDSYISNDSTFDTADFIPAALETGKYKGKQYGIPIDMSEPVLFYRKDLLPNPPKTWDEALDIAKKFSKSTNPNSPTQFGTTLYAAAGFAEPAQLWEELFWPNGGEMFDKDLNPTINNEAGKKATQYGVELVKNKLVPPDYTNYEYPQTLGAIQSGKVAFVQQWNAAWGDLSNKQKSPLIADKIGYAPIPGVMQKDGSIKRNYHVHSITLAINSASTHKEEAYKVISYLSGKEGGLNYTLNGGATPRKSIFNNDKVKQANGDYYSFLADEVSKYGKTEPSLISLTFINSNIMNKYLNAAWSGAMSVDDALANAEKDIKAQLAKTKE